MSIPTIPAGGTLLDTFKRSWVDVPVDADKDNAISTTEFLEASEALTMIFDALNTAGLTFVKTDILNNVKKVRTRQLEAPADSETVQALVLNELKTGKHTATEGLLWLVRGLEFTCIALSQNVANSTETVKDSFSNAYSASLKAHHNWVVSKGIQVAFGYCPDRATLYDKLGAKESSLEKVHTDLRPYLAALEKIVGILKGFQDRKEAKW